MAIVIYLQKFRADRVVRLFLCIILTSWSNLAVAQHFNKQPLNRAYDYLLNNHLDSCSTTLQKSPKNPYRYYLQLLSSTIGLFVIDDESQYRAMKKSESGFLSEITNEPFSPQEKNFLLAETHLQWGLIKLKYGDEFSGFWDIRQAASIAKATQKQYPDYLPNYKTLGLLHAMFGLVPDKYDWVMSLFGLEGDLSAGLKELRMVANESPDFTIEAHVLLALLKGYLIGESEEAVSEMKKAYEMRKSIFINYLYALLLMKNAQSETAFGVLIESGSYHQFEYSLYLKGEIFLQQGHYHEAIKSYKLFGNATKGISLKKDAVYKTAICYYLLGDTAQFNFYKSKITLTGNAKNEADKYAQSAIENNDFSYSEIFKLRYATDGGFFQLAEKISTNINEKALNAKDLCEYHYRNARLAHRTKKIDVAVMEYKKTLEVQSNKNWYYAPNAALQLATIYANNNDLKNARSALILIDEYKGYPYENSIRQQAKTLKKRID